MLNHYFVMDKGNRSHWLPITLLHMTAIFPKESIERAVIIIIENFPPKIPTGELERLIKPLLKGRFLQKTGFLKSLRMLRVSDIKRTFSTYYYIALIVPDEVGKRIIEKLNGTIIFSARLDVHEYIVRNWRNDPRLNNERPKKIITDRRKIDRRRPGLILKAVHQRNNVSFNQDYCLISNRDLYEKTSRLLANGN